MFYLRGFVVRIHDLFVVRLSSLSFVFCTKRHTILRMWLFVYRCIFYKYV